MTPATLDITIYRGTTLDPIIFNTKDASGNTVNLSGWSVFAQSRNGQGKVLDMLPVITNSSIGQVTIQFSATQTAAFSTGTNQWDLLFKRPTGEVLGPYITGKLIVKDTVSKSS